MFTENQPLLAIDRKELPAKAGELKKDGYRIVQVCACCNGDNIEVTYSFDKGGALLNVRVSIPKADPKVPSITGTYLAALTYENELQDLFGLKVEGLAVDFGGKFYRAVNKAPFLNPTPQGGK